MVIHWTQVTTFRSFLAPRLRRCNRRLSKLVCTRPQDKQPQSWRASSTRSLGKVQHREGERLILAVDDELTFIGHCSIHQERGTCHSIDLRSRRQCTCKRWGWFHISVRLTERRYMALHSWSQFRKLRNTRNQALYLLLPWPLRNPSLQDTITSALWKWQ